MATSTTSTEQRQNTLPRRVNISSQIPTPSHHEIPRNTTPLVKIRAKDYNLWFDGKEAEIFIKKVENIAENEGAKKKKRFEDESWDEVLNQVKELTHKLKNTPQPEPQPRNEGKESDKEVLHQRKTLPEAVNLPRRKWNNKQEQRLPQNNQPYRPSNPLPQFSSSYQPYIPAKMELRAPLKFVYCKEEGHSATRCIHLADDLDRRIVRTQGESYLFPNYLRVPMEGNESAKNIVRAFAK
ncbi:hypothetical protein O181_060297 [Austropuccinia psidii MF-1]|uniref:Uncharacterized protein n=1 Tax=Austropuccinia psidii MF-1 TaxID=1389203 RepID=A0A9Q3EIF3_9BASI|nr:hypothetical protein [Austropuccinia psidii MF-1]